MKILHIIDSLRSGGKERQLVEALKFLTRQDGYECELVIMSNEIHYSYLEELHVNTYHIVRKSKKDLLIYCKLYKIIKTIKPDIIHSWESMCSVYALPIAKILNIKFVNGFLRNAPPKLAINSQAWIRSMLTFPFSDVIAANSYAGIETYKVPHKKRACLHNGFDFNRIEGLADKQTVREKLDIQTPYVVGMVASFSKNKDYSTFIDAAQIVLEKRKDITFVAVGEGEYFEYMKNKIENEYQENFRFPGNQRCVLNIVNIFDIGILATFTEGISNAIMEYMALKKPVIVTDCLGNRELVEDNRTGYIVKPAEPTKLVEKILLLLKNKELAEQFGQNGYSKLKNEFSLDIMGNKFLKLYNNLTAFV